MATVLSELPLHGLHKQTKYPWQQWFDGRAWELRRGEDFGCTARSMRSSAIQAAKRMGCRCKTRLVDDSVIVIEAVWPDDHAYSIAKRIREQRSATEV